jgi:hypothetical protein
MKQGTHVILYKRKGNPIITAHVVDDVARIAMPLDEFKKLLLEEVGSVTWVLKDATFEQKVSAAFENIVRGMKEGATVIV